ncbi:MAG TPA: tRNA preQ1(34) S-adenosylmethionine ribosyltransferase-isomerase QueA [Fibrobacteraceae bacterium]|nr:tRNA preQ1(34) S-adenosylmethionine ribosyltransferase-isomerase QueA [Fibrobacteraceae bacterium]
MNPISFNLSDYDFQFPSSLIAQRSAGKGKTRILHVPLDGGPLQEMPAPKIVDLFRAGDCLVVNNTKVIPARLLGRRPSGGAVEILLLQALPPAENGEARWESMVRPGRAFRVGAQLDFSGVSCVVEQIQEDGNRVLHFQLDAGRFGEFLQSQGHVPLPPYIGRDDDASDRQAYQTIFAKYEGAVAAPTASLHFSQEMLDDLRARGVLVAEVTLHVGAGTFQNIQHQDFRKHQMHGERYHLDDTAVQKIQESRSRGGRIVTVGTTSTRVLETVADDAGQLRPSEGVTHAFIYPGYRFKAVDGLLTNFHWPKSSLILLVSAMLGRERTLEAYHYAVDHEMKLFSYGDGMLIL